MAERREVDYDLKSAIDYHLSITPADIADVLAQVPGEADESDWYWIVRMADDRFALIWGGCDYTGWDCQSAAWITYADSPEDAANGAEDSASRKNVAPQLLAQLRGEQPYATYLTEQVSA